MNRVAERIDEQGEPRRLLLRRAPHRLPVARLRIRREDGRHPADRGIRLRSRSRSATVRSLSTSEDLSQADLSAQLAAAIKLYTSLSSDPYGDEALAGLAVTPTEACTVAAALLRAQSLTPFEFSIWFSAAAGGRAQMPVDPRVKMLAPITTGSPTSARCSTTRAGADASGSTTTSSSTSTRTAIPRGWAEVLEYMENPVMRRNSEHDLEAIGRTKYVPSPGGRGFMFQAMQGRVPHQELTREPLRADRRARASRAVPPGDGRDEHRRPGRLPDVAAALGMAPVRSGEAQWPTPTTAGWSSSSAPRSHGSSSFRTCRSTIRRCPCASCASSRQARRRRLPGDEHSLRPCARQQVHAGLRGDRGDRAAARLPRRPLGRRLDEDDEPLHLRARDLASCTATSST